MPFDIIKVSTGLWVDSCMRQRQCQIQLDVVIFGKQFQLQVFPLVRENLWTLPSTEASSSLICYHIFIDWYFQSREMLTFYNGDGNDYWLWVPHLCDPGFQVTVLSFSGSRTHRQEKVQSSNVKVCETLAKFEWIFLTLSSYWHWNKWTSSLSYSLNCYF